MKNAAGRIKVDLSELYDLLENRESAKSNDENTVVCVSSSVLSNQSVINETMYLQTLVLKIEHNGKELKVRTILDSGSQKSCISERVIKVLKL
ncbi:hypothetical protein TNIN_139861 [Trichonephila inaurata madagascariensis]|uniref:Peptidase aspartic putative domain-containing protein n=1 Tax=Trichonephila inaurata madagascariensis TaxID=2747483 RepID=A0A8X6WUG6_9ARAC|nr:hypothetical protein TNIN_139861 [Trichonephila inaurata madagascariensis]